MCPHLQLAKKEANSCSSFRNLDGLLDILTRIYTKPKGMNPNHDDHVILSSKRRTVEDFCNKIHKDMIKQF